MPLTGYGLVLLALLLMLLAALARWRGRGLLSAAGLPAGAVIYQDGAAWFRQEEALVADDLQLVGRPDYLVQEADGMIVPVEVKSGLAPARPHEGHVMQLAAYCLLVTKQFGLRPDHGILQYRDQSFALAFTPELEGDVLDLLAQMRADWYEDEVERDHEHWQKCRHCGLRRHCDQRLI